MWNGREFDEAELAPLTKAEGRWLSTHQMRPAMATGALKSAVTAIASLLATEVDLKRLATMVVRRDLSGKIDPERTLIPLEAMPAFAASFDLDLHDLWADYVEREERISIKAMEAAEAARRKAEAGDAIPPSRSQEDFDSLPEWAQDWIRELRDERFRVTPAQPDGQRALQARERRSLLNVIGALVETCLDQSPGGQRYSLFASQAALVDTLVARYPSTPGVTQRTLEGFLAKARRSIRED